MTSKCPKCGAVLEDWWKFCPNCGQAIRPPSVYERLLAQPGAGKFGRRRRG